jgi:RNA polymerase sigma factor (sigma-70 family)
MTTATDASHPADSTVIAASVEHPEVFSTVFDRHFTAVHGYLVRRLGVLAADDVASETFTVAFINRHRYDSAAGADARPWLFGIAANLARRRRRDERRQLAAYRRTWTTEGLCDPIEEVVDRLDAAGTVRALASALAAMPARDREVLLLHAWANLEPTEIARALGLPPGTARSRLHRARNRLRDTIASLEGTQSHD